MDRYILAIGIDADEALAVDLDGLDVVGLGPRIGQRQESRALVGEHVADRALREGRVRPGVRDLIDEPGERTIALVDTEHVRIPDEVPSWVDLDGSAQN